jgi:hypothetical protein
LLTRKFTMGMLAATVIAAGGCSSSQKFANKARPPLPVNLTVYINDSRISVAPNSVGAGAVIFEVTNNASHAESVAIERSGGGQTLAATGPITPQATAQVAVNLASGDYSVTTSSGGGTDASLAASTSIQPAVVHVGARRPTSHGVLMTP